MSVEALKPRLDRRLFGLVRLLDSVSQSSSPSMNRRLSSRAVEGSVSWGVGYYVARRRDLLAIGMNWSRPSDTTIEPGLGDQYTMELFYRIQLAADLAITPDLQLIINPALDPSRDSILVAGLRLRLAI